jgi:hypothetical protein
MPVLHAVRESTLAWHIHLPLYSLLPLPGRSHFLCHSIPLRPCLEACRRLEVVLEGVPELQLCLEGLCCLEMVATVAVSRQRPRCQHYNTNLILAGRLGLILE